MARRWDCGRETPGEIAVLDLTPNGFYYGGDPIYTWPGVRSSLPSRGVRALKEQATHDVETAWARGVEYAQDYLDTWPMQNFSEVLGVTRIPDDTGRDIPWYAPVVNTYHSNC